MPLDFNRARPLLQNCQFLELFVEHLGWEKCRQKVTLKVNGRDYILAAVAEKRGFTVWLCESADGKLPDRATRLKLDRALSQTSFEHLIVFIPTDKSCQSWLWVRREPGRPLRAITHDYSRHQPGDSLLQKIQLLFVSLEEEEAGLSVTEIAGRVRAAFNVERVTKKFYEEFKKQHTAFLGFIDGLSDVADREWYASVMLNRLMFVYFIQRKGFLDGDGDYLRNRLNLCQREKGKDKFYSFYRYFLLRLFHEGLGGKQRPAELEKLLGRIPYLNGGMFDKHAIEERHGDQIQIPDKAFERVFSYFDQYQWHLDERPLRADNEINPDVLGYIFEKYINQKQMGAYYTKEDITDYIGKNTIIPFLFDAARKECLVAFENPNGPTLWDSLRDNPDRYIYAAVRKGVELPLPKNIEAGVKDVAKRDGWNKSADPELALPTEIWREVVARRNRYAEIRKRLSAGEVRDINELITLNLDIRQFAQDVIEDCSSPDLLRALWLAIQKVTILDPTCGSGAFLFAALNILEPLYEGCLDRMAEFVAEAESSGNKQRLEKLSDFREMLKHVGDHVSAKYFIYKSIILQNLYGVDIMEEAVEICKLRLFLKLAAQVEPDVTKPNLGIEPLPDIDFNICAGNTLVGYATLAEVQNSMFGRNYLERIQKADEQIRRFRKRQSQSGDLTGQREDKQQIRELLSEIREKLDTSLFTDYGARELSAWRKSHQPFHWYVEFNSIIQSGGFDVIIGNPPYVELNALDDYQLRSYKCEDSGNLYALVIERCSALGQKNGQQGYIVPVSSISTDRYATLQHLLAKREDHFSSFDDRPSRLFDGLEHIRLTIHLLGKPASGTRLFSTRYNKWSRDERVDLFGRLTFSKSDLALVEGTLPKLCSELESSIIQKLRRQQRQLCSFFSNIGRHKIFYSRKVGYFLQVLDFEPRVLDGQGKRRPPSEFKEVRFSSEDHAKLALCCLNSNLFYWFVTVFSDCRHVNKREVDAFPIDLKSLAENGSQGGLLKLAKSLMADLEENSESRTMKFKHDTLTVQCIYAKNSKPIIDEIDRELARHYGFTAEELDFIINYDIKYRLGRGTEENE